MGRPAAARSGARRAEPKPLAPAPVVLSRRRQRVATASILIALSTGAVVDHARRFARGGGDWSRFDHRRSTVVAVTAADELTVRSAAGGPPEPVHLTGLSAPPPGGRGADDGRRFLSAAAGASVTLLLETPATRDAAGRLRAYAYAADGSCLNVEVVKAGWAKVDRRNPSPFDGLLRPAEADARKHGRGVWAGEAQPEAKTER